MHPKTFADIDFYGVDKAPLLEFKPIDRRLTCRYLNYDYPEDEYYGAANSFIVKSFYELFHFVSGELTPNVVIKPDSFTSSNAYTENRIQLGTKVFACTKFTQQHKVDSMYAIMIHEMWHKRYTNRDIVTAYLSYNVNVADFYDSKPSRTLIKKLLPNVIIAEIFNILEDRRIERLGLEEFPGFVFFFDKLREYCVDLHNNKVANEYMLSSLILEFLMFKVLLPEMLVGFMGYVDEVFDYYKSEKKTPKFKKKDLIELMDLITKFIERNKERVYSDSVVDLITVSREIYELMPKDISFDMDKDMGESGKKFNGTFGDFVFDNDSGKTTDKKYDDEVVDKIKSDIAVEIEKAEKQRNESKIQEEDAEKCRTEKINIDAFDLSYDDITIFNPKCTAINNFIYDQAKKMSQNISSNLGFISSRLNQINTVYEQEEGDIDEDELYSIGYAKDIFTDEEPKQGFELDFGILIDESGSMADPETKTQHAKIAALGVTLAVKDSNHVNLFVYGHSQGRHKGYTKRCVELYEYYNTKRRVTEWKNIFAVGAKGGNADGFAIAKVGEIMMNDSKNKNKILVVISDGLPAAAGYGGDKGEKHVKSVVDALEKKGIEVVQICIDNIENSGKMFKNFIPFDNMGNFIKKLKEVLQKKLTKFSDGG